MWRQTRETKFQLNLINIDRKIAFYKNEALYFSKINWSNFTIIARPKIFFDSIKPTYRVAQFAHDGRIKRYFFSTVIFSTADRRLVIQSAFSMDFNGILRWPERASRSKPIDRLIKKIELAGEVDERKMAREYSKRNGHSKETIKRRQSNHYFHCQKHVSLYKHYSVII